jgi:hypothetical protein
MNNQSASWPWEVERLARWEELKAAKDADDGDTPVIIGDE